jgi:hypothetical protein
MRKQDIVKWTLWSIRRIHFALYIFLNKIFVAVFFKYSKIAKLLKGL